AERDGRRDHRAPILAQFLRKLLRDDQVAAQRARGSVLLGGADRHHHVVAPGEVLLDVLPDCQLEQHAVSLPAYGVGIPAAELGKRITAETRRTPRSDTGGELLEDGLDQREPVL